MLKKLLVDPEGFEFLQLYRNSMICPVTDGMTQVCFAPSYSQESRHEAEKDLAPGLVIVMVLARVDEQGQRWVKREDRPVASLALETPPPLTQADIQWSKEESARREIEAEAAKIKHRWALA